MRWAKVAAAVGSLLLVVCFSLATDTPISATVDGQSVRCADVISPGSLVSGQPSRARDAKVAVACAGVEQRATWALWSGLTVGGLLLLAGWTALRDRERTDEAPRRRGIPAAA